MGLSYEESKKKVFRGLILLAFVTLAEVFISLLGKGYIIPGFEKHKTILYIAGLCMIILSVYKAYFIIYEFMHLKYEVKSMALTIILPLVLLIWMVIAFLWEGVEWGSSRDKEQLDVTEYIDETKTYEYQKAHGGIKHHDKDHSEDDHSGGDHGQH